MGRRQGLTEFEPGLAPAVVDALLGDCRAARKSKSPVPVYCGDAAALRLAEEQFAKHPPPDPDAANLLYVRGLAGLSAGKGAEASAAFQKILDHKGRLWPRRSLAFLGLARASVLTGDTAKARHAYQDFFTLWKNADPDLPTLIAARKEYAVLPGAGSPSK